MTQLVSVPFDRDKIAGQLARGEVDLALNVLPRLPDRIRCEALIDERFVCIARADHPEISGALELPTFLRLQHALVAPRGTPYGAVDRALAAIGEKRNIAMSVANFISLPFLIADSDMIAVVGARVAERLAGVIGIKIYEVPIPLHGFTMSMAWDLAKDSDAGHNWFRNLIRSRWIDH